MKWTHFSTVWAEFESVTPKSSKTHILTIKIVQKHNPRPIQDGFAPNVARLRGTGFADMASSWSLPVTPSAPVLFLSFQLPNISKG